MSQGRTRDVTGGIPKVAAPTLIRALAAKGGRGSLRSGGIAGAGETAEPEERPISPRITYPVAAAVSVLMWVAVVALIAYAVRLLLS